MTPPSDDSKPPADTTPKGEDLGQQQQQLFQQQLQQQQLQLLQLQQQQLQSLSQNMSPNELAAFQQQQLALLMMPMFPLMMPLQQQALAAASSGAATAASTTEEATDTSTEAATTSEEAAAESAAAAATSDDPSSPNYQPPTAESLGLTSPFVGTDGFGMLAGTSAPLNIDELPKRKRGRPPKKDVAARAKAEAEKTLKQQFPMWGYGLPMPLLPGFTGMLPGMSNPGAVVKDHSATDDGTVKEEDGDGERPAKMAKKKQRGTGKPRGRPRTRPRPGEIIRRVKPLPIAPANYSVMYNYSLSNLAQKSAELNADGSSVETDATTAVTEDAQDENRLAPLSASLLSGEHE
jgi:hypothetical protein